MRHLGRIHAIAAMLLLCNMACPAEPADITSGLRHHWKFDETSGNTAADSVAGNDGSLFNWTIGEPKWVAGKVGGALDFGDTVALGNDNYVLTDSPISFDAYTIAFFLKTRNDPYNLNPRLVTPTDGYEGWVVLNQQYNKGVGFYYQGGVTVAQDPNPPTTDMWEHYAVAYDRLAGFATVYRDGLQVASGTVAGSATTLPLGKWVFGHHDNIVDHVDDSLLGQMDDIRIYDRLLAPADIAMLSEPFLVPEPSTLALAALGILLFGFRSWRRRRRA